MSVDPLPTFPLSLPPSSFFLRVQKMTLLTADYLLLQVTLNHLSIEDINNLTRKFTGVRALNPSPKSASSAIQLLVQKAVTVNWPSVADKDWTLPERKKGQTGEDRVTHLARQLVQKGVLAIPQPFAPESSPLSSVTDSDANVDDAEKVINDAEKATNDAVEKATNDAVEKATNDAAEKATNDATNDDSTDDDAAEKVTDVEKQKGHEDPSSVVVYSFEETPGMCDPKLPVPEFTICTLTEDPAEQDLEVVHWSFLAPDPVMDYDPEKKTIRARVTRLIVVDFTAQAQPRVEVTRFNWLEVTTDPYFRRAALSTDLKSLLESLVKSKWSPFSNEASCEIYWALASHPDVPKIGPIARVMDTWHVGNIEYLVNENSPIPVTASSKYCQRVLLVVCPYKAPIEAKSGKILKPKDAAAVAWLKQAVAQDASLADTIERIKSTKKGQPVQELVRWMTAVAKILSDYGRVPHRVADDFESVSGQKISKVHIGHIILRDPNWISEAHKVNQQRVRLLKAFSDLPKGAKRSTARQALNLYLGSNQIAGMESFGRKLTALETEHLEIREAHGASSSDEEKRRAGYSSLRLRWRVRCLTVIAVGPGAPRKDGTVVPTAVKAGDRVLLPGWGGNSIKVGDEVSGYGRWTVDSVGWAEMGYSNAAATTPATSWCSCPSKRLWAFGSEEIPAGVYVQGNTRGCSPAHANARWRLGSRRYPRASTCRETPAGVLMHTDTRTPKPAGGWARGNKRGRLHAGKHPRAFSCTQTPARRSPLAVGLEEIPAGVYVQGNTRRRLRAGKHPRAFSCTQTPARRSPLAVGLEEISALAPARAHPHTVSLHADARVQGTASQRFPARDAHVLATQRANACRRLSMGERPLHSSPPGLPLLLPAHPSPDRPCRRRLHPLKTMPHPLRPPLRPQPRCEASAGWCVHAAAPERGLHTGGHLPRPQVFPRKRTHSGKHLQASACGRLPACVRPQVLPSKGMHAGVAEQRELTQANACRLLPANTTADPAIVRANTRMSTPAGFWLHAHARRHACGRTSTPAGVLTDRETPTNWLIAFLRARSGVFKRTNACGRFSEGAHK
ncbi:hypothetical protein GGX14DRAFT_675448 [Mycena pura]|uniref:Uncharacterized protein n=1 Tax=Mycena pura TaxID=153505 RepID=A0AAD6YGR0_9AGAR|nr:hypothetical protein GGX14DRAFT_675448 [Mycena pura]